VSARYQGSLATYLDVLNAEDTLVAARRSEAELEARALILDVSLVRALGGGFDATGPSTASSASAAPSSSDDTSNPKT